MPLPITIGMATVPAPSLRSLWKACLSSKRHPGLCGADREQMKSTRSWCAMPVAISLSIKRPGTRLVKKLVAARVLLNQSRLLFLFLIDVSVSAAFN
jgi:hypothetical protein